MKGVTGEDRVKSRMTKQINKRMGIKVLNEGKGIERVGQLRQSCRPSLRNS